MSYAQPLSVLITLCLSEFIQCIEIKTVKKKKKNENPINVKGGRVYFPAGMSIISTK